jgi:hypothetical protein
MNAQPFITNHARLRMAQRNVSLAQLSFILEHGQEVHCAGAVLITLRRKDIPEELQTQNEFTRLEGVTVVLSREESVVMTVWRNRRQGLRHIRDKPRYSC